MTHEEALTKIKTWHLDDDKTEVLSVIIPELKESGDVEKRLETGNNALMKCLQNSNAQIGVLIEENFNLREELKKQKETKPVEQKPAWSGEDERIRYAICDTLDRIDEHIMEYNRQLTHQQVKDWLKFLKDRMQPQPKPAWSEEDEVMLGNALYACKEKYCSTETYNWLKSLKDRTALINKNDFDRGYEVGISAAKFNQWKPTEEQLEALEWSLRDYRNVIFEERHDTLTSLYKDLKKL